MFFVVVVLFCSFACFPLENMKRSPIKPSEPLGEDFPCFWRKVFLCSVFLRYFHYPSKLAQLRFSINLKNIYACVSDFINVPEKIADKALSNFPFHTG